MQFFFDPLPSLFDVVIRSLGLLIVMLAFDNQREFKTGKLIVRLEMNVYPSIVGPIPTFGRSNVRVSKEECMEGISHKLLEAIFSFGELLGSSTPPFGRRKAILEYSHALSLP
ncbi:MAG: hypothetical protein WBJ68_18425 [Candidatus Dechloromonas phosphoritropha]